MSKCRSDNGGYVTMIYLRKLAGAAIAVALFSFGCGGSGKNPPPKVDSSVGDAFGGTGGSNIVGGSGGSVGGTGGSTGGTFGVPDAGVVDAPVATEDAAPDGAVDSKPTLSMSPVPAPWVSEDIGPVGMPGGSGRVTGQWQVQGSGADIFGTADQFQFLHRPITGDVEMVVKMVSLERNNENTKAGLMLREGVAPDARDVFMMAHTALPNAMGVLTGKGSRLQYRDKRTDDITGFYDEAATMAGAPDQPPLWLRLIRKGMLFTGFVSNDGLTWFKDGEIAIATMPPELQAGLGVTSHDNNSTSLAVFESLQVTALTDATIAHAELGTLGSYVTGSSTKLQIETAGRGVANTRDGLPFVHKLVPVAGDTELTVHVTGLTSTKMETLRAGVMLRTSVEAGSRMASFFIDLSTANGQRTILSRRAQDSGNVSNTTGMVPNPAGDGGAPDAEPADAEPSDAEAVDAAPKVRPDFVPTWVKLVRVGNRFVGFTSLDGRTWTAVADVRDFVIAQNAFVGVFATSQTEASAATATLERFTVAAPTTPLPLIPDAAVPPDTAPPTVDAGTGADARD
jgi:hypothetical protein